MMVAFFVGVGLGALVYHHASEWLHAMRSGMPLLETRAITAEDVERYRMLVCPEIGERSYIPGRPVAVPGDEYIAKLDHARFREWFGTTCDHRCPHRVDPLPKASAMGGRLE